MSWAAANAPQTQRNQRDESSALASKRRSTETVEAALSRLSKAYSMSMECIGALDKTNAMLQKEPSRVTEENLAMLERVATAARSTLQTAILLDPLVAPHLPTLRGTMQDFLDRNDDSSQRWQFLKNRRPDPPVLSSAAHKTTIRELAYLSLVNFSDLLQSCCIYQPPQTKDHPSTSILDRGIVKQVATLKDRNRCCWKGEGNEDTQRLALTALCDASKLDGTDPVLWIKLACASRGLERLLKLSTMARTKHRRLQRYALEQGIQALPEHIPPNRTVQLALQELVEEPEPEEYTPGIVESEDCTQMVIELPRYSWSMLARMLLRASREGADYHAADQKSHTQVPASKKSHMFGSPMIEMKLSPMLVMPTRVLAKICIFLDNGSIWRFEATCRALSVSIMSARASGKDDGKLPHSNLGLPDSPVKPNPKKPQRDVEKTNEIQRESSRDSDGMARENHRSSQRLRSQQITSGKKAERLAKRQSFEYCFLAAVSGKSLEEHQRDVQEAYMNEAIQLLLTSKKAFRSGMTSCYQSGSEGHGLVNSHQRDALERMSDSSLAAFVSHWKNNNSGPMDLLMKYLVHVSMNVEDVFGSEVGGTVVLTSSILSCFDAYLRRRGYQDSLTPTLCSGDKGTRRFWDRVKGFAVDLLHGELLLKQCDRYVASHIVSYDEESNKVTLLVPDLFRECCELNDLFQRLESEFGRDAKVRFCTLQARCNWFIACFYLWRSRIARQIFEAQEAEEEGIAFIEEAIKVFDSRFMTKTKVLPTPHLVSPGRTEPYWKELSPESLSRYRDEIQASSVVSVAREKFQALANDMDATTQIASDDADKSGIIAQVLSSVGERLCDRYKADFGNSASKHYELVEDFLARHGHELTLGETPKVAGILESMMKSKEVSTETLQQMENPSILEMLVLCMNVQGVVGDQILFLLVDVIFSAQHMYKALIQRFQEARMTKSRSDAEDFSDSDDDSIMSEDSRSQKKSNKTMDESRAMQLVFFVAYLVDRILDLAAHRLKSDDKLSLSENLKINQLTRCVMEMASNWFETTSKVISTEDTGDLTIFHSISHFVTFLLADGSSAQRTKTAGQYMKQLIHALILQHQVFKQLISSRGDRSTRAIVLRTCMRRVDFISALCIEAGILFSDHPGSFLDGRLLSSGIIAEGSVFASELQCFIDCLLWFWKFASQITSEGEAARPSDTICNAFQRPLVSNLRIPVAILIVALCGALSTSRNVHMRGDDSLQDQLCLSEFYDSDSSASEWLSSNDGASIQNRSRKEIFRISCHVVHCLDLIISKVDDKAALSVVDQRYQRPGPVFPYTCLKVLNRFADLLLSNLGQEADGQPDLWSTQYPYGTQTVGEILDFNLHKIYRWVYGFVLVGEKNHAQTTGKDLASSIAPINDLAVSNCKLPNITAAAQLYRCIQRGYAGGRRSPPKKALELVLSALPAFEESEKTKALKCFLFNSSGGNLTSDNIIDLVHQRNDWGAPFSGIVSQLRNEDEAGTAASSQESNTVMRVRRGILSQLASGLLPVNVNENTRGKSEHTSDDDRVATMKTEEELSKKLSAVLDDIFLGDSTNSEGWYRAAQCAIAKAEAIADRLGLNRGFLRRKDLTISLPQPRFVKGMKIETLLVEQNQEDEQINANWVTLLGNDLSVFAKYSWSAHSSLQLCAEEVGASLANSKFISGISDVNSISGQRKVWKLIDSLHKNGDLLGWQEAWGGIFVFALRAMAVRLMSVALFLLQSKEIPSKDENILVSEMCESLGILFYAELMGSQNYGYPMRPMGTKRKRELAITSKSCFEAAAKAVNPPGKADDGSEEAPATWDLEFMIGKCEEKIARTFELEAFPTDGEERRTRLYEKHMSFALENYAAALAQAKDIQANGGVIETQSGGSSHGDSEILYRIHASRLKCVIAAAKRHEDEFQQAEEEALRLTERHWFKEPETTTDLQLHIRERVWNVLADIVSGLVQCRLDQPYFHRSVYRHAQALCWAPILYDPLTTEGSQDTVPATRAFKIRGLNNSTAASQSAEIVLNSLFDKKRSQLCAVWVTPTSAASPFQVLNNSTRKYDSLRGKYISAYVEVLRLSRRRGKVETFLKGTYSCRRDSPSYFQTSALAGGGIPPKSHANEPLLLLHNSLQERGFLRSVKRESNSALADILVHEIDEHSMRAQSVDESKKTENFLKLAYSTYLRLNCSRKDLDDCRAWRYGANTVKEVEAMCQAFLAYSSDTEIRKMSGASAEFGDWSGGGRKEKIFDAAIEKCKSLFPTLTGSYFSKKAIAGVKSKKTAENEGQHSAGGKRKELPEEETIMMPYEVSVPSGVSPGESFLTTVRVGDFTKRLKLTVPETNATTLRFTVRVPKSSSEQAAKKLREDNVATEESKDVD